MVIKALLDASLAGVGKVHRTPVFPCSIFQCMKGVNRKPGDPNYDLFRLALKSTAKRLYPNYANADWSAQQEALKQDRDFKQNFIDSLTKDEYEKLIKQLKENPELKDILMLDIVED